MKQQVLDDLIENLFTFDVIGPNMMKLRKSPDDESLQQKLTEALRDAAIEKCRPLGDEELAQIEQAARNRVLTYVRASKSARGKGCG